MAFLWMDSFDHMVGADLAAKYNTAGGTISAGAGRRGSAAYYANAGPAYTGGLTRTLAPADNTCILGVAVKLGDVSSSGYYYFLGVLKAGTVQCSVNINASGYLQLYRGDNGGTLLATAATQPLIANTYSYVELKVVVHPSTGSATLRVDGTSVLTVPTANTAAGGSAGWDQVRIGGNSFAIAYPSLDDYYVLDGSGSAPLNDFLGNVRVDAGYPTGAGATTGWTPSAGANYACVDEATPNGDTDYVTASSSPLTRDLNSARPSSISVVRSRPAAIFLAL